ncbi:MAG: hypothetical protein ASARMPREDX12_002493 [Alectoria sarmentosa]|nr:MAG: hypothetical protein ASARMPREDX12_002493 [Alectoria sarmentosa]
MNVFRILGDLSHTASKCILVWAIHANQSAEGVSLITQLLYVGVFITRYLDLFWTSPFGSIWNFSLKIFYILSSLYIIFLMMQVYARTREREKAWRLGAYCLGGSVLLAPIATVIAQRKNFFEMLWTFSIILESVCVIPQLLLLRQTTVPTVIDSFYLLTLGSYRAFYILNWIVRLASPEHHFEWRAVFFGIVQTAFYVDFAWVYWTRQRVKLRNGGVVDSDDLSRGFLVSRVLGRGDTSMDDEERGTVDGVRNDGIAGVATKKVSNWGTRGISVSADEDVMDQTQQPEGNPRAKDFVDMMEEDESGDEIWSSAQDSNGRLNHNKSHASK